MERPSFGGKPMQELSYRIGILLSSYSQAINKQNGTTGSLFQQKTKAKCVNGPRQDAQNGLTGEYLVTCMHYIHQNPRKANLVEKIEDWKYSSFRDYIGEATGLKSNKALLLALTGYDASSFYEDSYESLDIEIIDNIL